MRRLSPSFAVLVLALLLSPLSALAQQADTTAAGPAADSLQAPADSAAQAPADSAVQVPDDSTAQARADSLAADTLAADSLVADTAGVDSTALRKKRAREAAQTAADEWLTRIDGGDFDGSWAAADSTLRAGISQEDWADQGIRARAWLDTLRTRRLQRAQYRDSTAQLPGGHPVVILEYASEYAKGPAREAVITTKRDTTWAVAGYRVVSARGDSLQVRADTTQTDPLP